MTKDFTTGSERADFRQEGDAQDERSVSTSDFDAAAYLPMLDDLDMPDAQKREFLLILWDMMRMCIEIGVPAQSWGQIFNGIVGPSADDAKGIESKQIKRR